MPISSIEVRLLVTTAPTALGHGLLRLPHTNLEPQGVRHFIHVDLIEAIENGEVRLNRTASQTKDEWGTAT